MIDAPTNWTVATGEDLFSLVRGVSYDKSAASTLPAEGLIPILRANNISNGQIIRDELVYVPSRYVSRDQLLQEGDLLIAASSGSRTVVGKAARVSGTHRGFAFGAFCTVARPRLSEHSPWISYYMRTHAYREYVERVALGININNLRGSDLAAMPIKIAPLAEGHRIGAKIDSLFAKSKRARDQLDPISRLVEKYRQAILRAAFRGDLTTDWREANPATESGAQLRQRLLKQKTEWQRQPDFANERDLDVLPKSWTWMPVEAITSKVVDGVHKKPSYVAEGIPFLTVKNLTAGPNISFSDCRFITPGDHAEFTKRTNPEEGDILITKDGTLGVTRAIRTDTIFSIFVSLALVKPIDRQMTDYLELAFQSPLVQEQMIGVGSGLQHIHLTDLKRDFIPIAPEQERPEVINRVRVALAWIDRLAHEARNARKLIDHLDQAILTKAFQGELVPQDPADEPAAVFLERIRAERAIAPAQHRRGNGERAASEPIAKLKQRGRKRR